MPLIRPEIQQILRKAGLQGPAPAQDQTLTEKLDASGLDLVSVLDELNTLAKSSGNEALRLRALETALKAHGALKDTAPAVPSFTIIIQDGASGETTNPQVNPILLPRQLLSTFKDNSTTVQ
jgi:hypothetical protein